MRWTRLVFLFAIWFLIAAACSCGGDDDDASEDQAAGDDDTGDDDVAGDDDNDPPGEPAFVTDRPFLLDRSVWYDHLAHGETTTIRSLGGQGVGNGTVFAAIGARLPLTSFHNATGPDYERGDRFFSDQEFAVTVGEDDAIWQEQWLWRVRQTPIVVARQKGAAVEFTTVDFAPIGFDDPLVENAIVRVAILRNLTGEAKQLGVRLSSNSATAEGASLIEGNGSGKRLEVRAMAAEKSGAKAAERAIWQNVGEIPPGGEIAIAFVYAFTYEGGDPEEVFDAVGDAGVDALLRSTYDWWRDWTNGGAKIVTPDVRFNDLIDSIRITTKSQQAATGATCPMYRYTRMWIRDTIGPARFFGDLGLLPDVRAMLDYFWHSVNRRGGLANSIGANNVFDTPPPVADWDSMGPGSGRTAAETPSYIPLQYWAYYSRTGDADLIEERYPMLRYCMLGLRFEHGMLLPFSGDETYRDVMKAGVGLWIGVNFHDEGYLSTNSSILYIAAANAMERMARDLGYDADADEYRALGDQARADMDATYWMDGYYAPFAAPDTLDPWPQPYEDVGTKLLWAGAAARDDEKAESEVLTLMETAGVGNGLAVTPLQFPYNILFDWAHDGLFTGMSQGYVLHALTELDHPLAAAAFFSLMDVFVDAGSVAEVHILDSFDQLMLFNDSLGLLGDFVARNRPWEGSICGAALLHYLIGAKPDVAQGRVDLTPHLPEAWDSFAANDLVFGDARYTVEVKYENGVRVTTVTAGKTGFTLGLTLSIPSESVTGLNLDGEAVDPASLPRQVRWGITRITLPDLDLAPGETFTAAAAYERR